MEINFQVQDELHQYRSVEAQISEQCLVQGPKSLCGDLELVSINQRKGNTKITAQAQLGDVEGEHDLQGRQPTEALVTGGGQQTQSEDHIVVNIGVTSPDTEAEDGLFSESMRYEGWLSFLENFVLGPNQANQIWRLRLLSGISFYIALLVGMLCYPDDRDSQDPDQRFMLLTSVIAPISVAVVSFFVTFWFASVPNKRSSCITGLSIANAIMLNGPLTLYWVHKRGTGN